MSGPANPGFAAMPHTVSPSDIALAQACGQAMWSRDAACQLLGCELLEVRPGFSRLAMTVRPDMVNGHRTCHGGLIFTLADAAFAYACNSRNHATVAAGAQIDFLAPAREGDLLEAVAEERSLAGRNGIYDVAVHTREGRLIAHFRGRSRRVEGAVLAD